MPKAVNITDCFKRLRDNLAWVISEFATLLLYSCHWLSNFKSDWNFTDLETPETRLNSAFPVPGPSSRAWQPQNQTTRITLEHKSETKSRTNTYKSCSKLFPTWEESNLRCDGCESARIFESKSIFYTLQWTPVLAKPAIAKTPAWGM